MNMLKTYPQIGEVQYLRDYRHEHAIHLGYFDRKTAKLASSIAVKNGHGDDKAWRLYYARRIVEDSLTASQMRGISAEMSHF